MSFWIQLIIRKLNITKSQYVEIFIIVFMGILNKIMYTWIQLLILTHLCKRINMCLCLFFQICNKKKREKPHHVYYFSSQIEFPKNCVLIIKCQKSRTGRKETKRANTGNKDFICIPEISATQCSSLLKYLIPNYKSFLHTKTH